MTYILKLSGNFNKIQMIKTDNEEGFIDDEESE